MLKKLFLYIAISLSASLAIAQPNPCPVSPLRSDELTIEGLQAFAARLSQGSVGIEQFACCLPEVFHQSYFLVHSSIAAQNSIPQSPRAIMTNFQFNRDGVTQLPTAYFSINGGHSSLRQTQAVEIALTNPETGHNVFFVMGFKSGVVQLSPPNPRMCVGCHGSNGSLGKTGPHLIFDGPKIWPRLVSGLDFLPAAEGHDTAPWFRDYITRLESESYKSLQTNPRFSCLAKRPPSANFQTLFDSVLQELNFKRVTPEIVQSQDYQKMKYAIYGSELCQKMLLDVDCQLSALEQSARSGRIQSTCSNWIHPQTLKSMRDVKSIFPLIRDVNRLDEMDRLALEAFHKRRAEMTNVIQQANQNLNSSPMPFDFRIGFLDEKSAVLPNQFRGIRSSLLRKYALDHELRSSQMNLLTRFLFESRGVSVGSWSTDIVGGYQRSGVSVKHLLQYDSKIRQSSYDCETLRNLSLQATSPGSQYR